MLLAIETSTAETVLALADEGELLASIAFRGSAKHEESLLPALETLLEAAGRERAALRRVAVGIGPGGFTSLRVGIASAKGLAIGLGLELVGVPSLRTLARGVCPVSGVVLSMTDARRREVNAALYVIGENGSRALLEPMHGEVSEVVVRAKELLREGDCVFVVGDGARAYQDALEGLGAYRLAPRAYDRPRPEALVVEALEAIARGEIASLDSLEPLYVKPSDAKLPAVKLRTSLG